MTTPSAGATADALRYTFRRTVGLLIVMGGMAALAHAVWHVLMAREPLVAQAWAAGWMAAAATALGTLPVWFAAPPSDRTRDVLMGFGAGVMLAASVFSLIVPALAAAEALGHQSWSRAGVVGAGILLGAAMLMGLERIMPHQHFIKEEPVRGPFGGRTARTRPQRLWLFVMAITLHNLPEGLAIGVAFGGGDAGQASALATGIAIQDVPEGLVIATALVAAGVHRLQAVLLGAASGLVEPLGALAGALLMDWSTLLLPWGLAVAAGAMLFVISHEIIPETHRQGHEVLATAGLMVGFVLMMVLDTALV